MQGRSLELYFVDGKPDGMLTAEVFNWTGHVLKLPRTRIVDALKRPETSSTGVYILLGEGEDGAPKLYVGEAETIRDRLRQHVAQKDWWEEAVVITTAGDALHKAHVKYLEARLVEIALSVGKAQVENGNTPARSSLNEAAAANMESFLATLMMVLPAIRVDHFDEKRRTTPTAPDQGRRSEVVFEMKVARFNVHAQAELRDGEMIVRKGSRVRSEWVGDRGAKTNYFKLHDELRANGTIEVADGVGVMAEDYAFASPSAAAAVVAGRSADGRTSWLVTETGRTYAEWELAQSEGTP